MHEMCREAWKRKERGWMWKRGSSARRAMRDTLLAATMAPSLRALALYVLLLLLLYPAVRTQLRYAPSVRLHRPGHWLIERFIWEYCGRALGGRGREARGGKRGHFCSPSLRETELQGHGEAGAHPGRFGGLFFFLFFSLCSYSCVLISILEEGRFPRRDRDLSAAQIFGALIWQIGFPDRLTARSSLLPALPPPPRCFRPHSAITASHWASS